MSARTRQAPGALARLALDAATVAYRLLYATLRVRLLLADGSLIRLEHHTIGRELFALCERDALALGGLLARARFTVLVTVGRDGDRAAHVLERLGCTVVRGSSRGRGTEALRELVRGLAASPGPAAIVADGPLGPAGVAKPGAVACAVLTGRPLHALAASARPAMTIPGTWSGLYLPAPGARVVVARDHPLVLPERDRLGRCEHCAEDLTRRLRIIRADARRAIISPPTETHR
jgi:lysophospholipid acyltransferase (LPLAT)-like uncharacterized protein